jgi:hypothetical protein
VVDVSNHAHVPDVLLLVHQGPDLLDGELRHLARIAVRESPTGQRTGGEGGAGGPRPGYLLGMPPGLVTTGRGLSHAGFVSYGQASVEGHLAAGPRGWLAGSPAARPAIERCGPGDAPPVSHPRTGPTAGRLSCCLTTSFHTETANTLQRRPSAHHRHTPRDHSAADQYAVAVRPPPPPGQWDLDLGNCRLRTQLVACWLPRALSSAHQCPAAVCSAPLVAAAPGAAAPAVPPAPCTARSI